MAKQTLKVKADNFSLTSQWKYKASYSGTKDADEKGKKVNIPTGWKLSYGPTSSSKKVQFKFSLPSGAKIKTSRVWAKISSGNAISVCTANGASFTKKKNGAKGANVKISKVSGSSYIKKQEVQKKIKDLNLNGNVDLTKRPIITKKKMKAAGWKDFDGTYATLYSTSYTGQIKTGETYTILLSPIQQNGTVLSPKEIDQYADNLFVKANNGAALKSKDSKKLLMYYMSGDHVPEITEIAIQAHNLSDEWESIKPSNAFTVTFKYKATGGLYKDENMHTGTCEFKNVYLLIEYEVEGGKETPAPTETPRVFKVPPQSVCIYDQTSKKVYSFDGVMKIQHNLTLDIQEEPDNKKKEYVNNAKNQPDKLTLDIVMSDVYTGGGTTVKKATKLTSAQNTAVNKTKKSIQRESSGKTRSETAFYVLHWLKEQRRKLSVITPQYVYTDMILASVTVNQDDSNTFGWDGQLVFQKAFKAKAAVEKKKKSSKDTGEDTPPTGTIPVAGKKYNYDNGTK